MNIFRQGSEIFIQEKAIKVTVHQSVDVSIESRGHTMTVDRPGEYEVNSVTVRAFQEDEGVAYLIGIEGKRIFFPAFVSLLRTEEEFKDTGGFDVLIVSAESSTWTVKEWKTFLEETEPRAVIFCENGDKTEKVRKELGIELVEHVDKAEISDKNIPSENIRFLILS